MTLVEFLAAVKNGTRLAQVSSVLYWNERYRRRESMTASELKASLVKSRVRSASTVNVAAVLLAGGAWVDSPDSNEKGIKLWQLTETGRREVRALHGLKDEDPEIEHGVADLAKVAETVADADARRFIDEAVLCLSIGALRAAIVFVWVGAMADIKGRVWSHGHPAVTTAFQKYYSKAKLATHDDLLRFNEVDILKVAQDLGEIDKAQHVILGQALDLRNQCGHPNKYWPTVSKSKAHIEDIANILWV